MGHIYRALIALLLAWSLPAAADYNAVKKWQLNEYPGFIYSTGEDACKAYPAKSGKTWFSFHSVTYSSPEAGGCNFTDDGTVRNNWTAVSATYTCPHGGTLNGTVCVGANAPPTCEAGTVAGSGYVNMGSNPSVAGNRKACHGGCEVIFQGSYPELRALVQGKWAYFGKGSYERTGTSCSAADVAVSTSAPTNQCASGQVLGEFNGQPLCLNGGTGEPTNPNTPTPSQTATTNTTSSTNPDGSTTKTETTTKPDGSQVVVMTTTNPDGSSTQTREEKPAPDADPKDDFCKKNPAATLCKTSEFSGGCSAYLCKGDAVYCAMALEQHRRNCELFENATPMSDLGKQIANGNDPQAGQHPANANNRSIIDLGTSLDMSKRWSGGCPTDRQITVMGQTMAIPLSSLCPYLEMFGNIIIALAMLGAARTVGVF